MYSGFPTLKRWNISRGSGGEVKTWRSQMKYAIVESGGKQYKAVLGETIEVDRLPVATGEQIELERVFLVADGDQYMIGAPTVSETVKATVVEHFKGPKIIVFKYRPKKRIRVKTGHRQQYTRLTIDQIGSQKAEKAAKAEAAPTVEKKAAAKRASAKKEAAAPKAAKKAPAKKAAPKTEKKAPAKKAAAPKTEKKAPAKKETAAKSTKSTASKAKSTTKKSTDK
jgi:large subunit ribosomal protein L21